MMFFFFGFLEVFGSFQLDVPLEQHWQVPVIQNSFLQLRAKKKEENNQPLILVKGCYQRTLVEKKRLIQKEREKKRNTSHLRLRIKKIFTTVTVM